MQIKRFVLDRRVVSSTCDSLFEFHKVVQRLLLFMNAAVLLILYVRFCLLETFVVIDAVHSTICWNLFIFLQAICIEWRIFLFFIVVWLLKNKNWYYVINENWIKESNQNFALFFLPFRQISDHASEIPCLIKDSLCWLAILPKHIPPFWLQVRRSNHVDCENEMDDIKVYFLEWMKQISLIKIKYEAMRTFMKFVKQIKRTLQGFSNHIV